MSTWIGQLTCNKTEDVKLQKNGNGSYVEEETFPKMVKVTTKMKEVLTDINEAKQNIHRALSWSAG